MNPIPGVVNNTAASPTSKDPFEDWKIASVPGKSGSLSYSIKFMKEGVPYTLNMQWSKKESKEHVVNTMQALVELMQRLPEKEFADVQAKFERGIIPFVYTMQRPIDDRAASKKESTSYILVWPGDQSTKKGDIEYPYIWETDAEGKSRKYMLGAALHEKNEIAQEIGLYVKDHRESTIRKLFRSVKEKFKEPTLSETPKGIRAQYVLVPHNEGLDVYHGLEEGPLLRKQRAEISANMKTVAQTNKEIADELERRLQTPAQGAKFEAKPIDPPSEPNPAGQPQDVTVAS